MKWNFNIASRLKKSNNRSSSIIELEGEFRMYAIQDQMVEMAIRISGVTEWSEMPPQERLRQEEEFRSRAEELHVLFKRPKDDTVVKFREELGLTDANRVHSYGDIQERKHLKQVTQFEKEMEKELHRLTRTALRQRDDLGNRIEKDIVNDIHSAMAKYKAASDMYEIFKSTFETVAGRKFISA